jgi:hypothetical protein
LARANPVAMNRDHEASRTLVKSPPELWAECSDAGSLARHLGEFGEIRITRLEPETIVAWEGERASGTVRIEPSGWGTKVTLTAQLEAEEPVAPPEPEAAVQEPPEPEAAVQEPPEPEAAVQEPPAIAPVAVEPPAAPPPRPVSPPAERRGLWDRLRLRFRTPPAPVAAPAPEPLAPPPPPTPPEPQPTRPPEPPADPTAATPKATQPDPTALLTAALDSLGQAHHRPFSRA